MIDFIAAIEAEGRRLREERKALGFTPEAKRARAAGRRARRAGLRFETEVARYLGGEVVPGSGAWGRGSRAGSSLHGDVRALGLRLECKRRRGALAALHALAAESPDGVVVTDAQTAERYWVGTIATFRRLGYDRFNEAFSAPREAGTVRMATVRRWLAEQGADALVHAERGLEDAIVVLKGG